MAEGEDVFELDKLSGSLGELYLSRYELPKDREWFFDRADVLRTDIGGAEDLLIAILLFQHDPSLIGQSVGGLTYLLHCYDQARRGGVSDHERAAKTISSALNVITELAGWMLQSDFQVRQSVSSHLIKYFGTQSLLVTVERSSIERVFIRGNRTLASYWDGVKHLA